MRIAPLFAVLAVSSLAACEVGVTPAGGDDTGGDDDDVQVDARSIDAPVAAYSLAVTPATATTTLGTETTFTVTIDPQHFDGTVELAATGAPTNWIVEITPAIVTVTDGVPATATVKVRVPSNGDAAPTGQTVSIDGSSTIAGAESGTAALTVAKTYIFPLSGYGTGGHWGALRGGNVRVQAGTLVRYQNNDTIGHRIHAGGGIGGFAHEPNTMNPGQTYDVTVTDGSDNFYCHDHGQGTGEVSLIVE